MSEGRFFSPAQSRTSNNPDCPSSLRLDSPQGEYIDRRKPLQNDDLKAARSPRKGDDRSVTFENTISTFSSDQGESATLSVANTNLKWNAFMRRQYGFILSLVFLFAPTVLDAKDFFLTIGGGYAPAGNQASLERNVLLFQRVLRERNLDHLSNDVFFSDGNATGHDLQVIDRSSIPKANQLMAEFFGNNEDLGLSYRDHQVPNVRGGTKPENIRNWFRDVGRTMKAGDRLVLYVTAHGNRSDDRRNPYDTTIATWNNTSIKMVEFVGMLDELPEGVEVVAIMVQCHAGGFARFIYNQGDPDKGVCSQRRTGFFATVHDRAAAGCTPEVDEASYVEYSTYFWAALAGHDRSGRAIELPDYDGDGDVSFAEAHAYTILTADTIDLPVKTSGEFLTVESKFGDDDSDLLVNDEPYDVLLSLATPSQKAILEGLSEQLSLTGNDRVVTAWKETQPQRGQGRGRSRGRRPEDPSSQVRRGIASDLKGRWPELANVLNPVAVELLTTRSDEFIHAIESHPDYKRYRELKNESQSVPDTQKRRVKYERFLRTADNVVLAENLRRMNEPEKLAQYEAIVQAESRSLKK